LEVREFEAGERERVEKYLLLGEDQLFSLIPHYLPDYKEAVFSPIGQREVGREWFAGVRGRLEQRLCREWQLCEKLDDPTFDDVGKLVIVVGDTVATVVAGVPPVLVASLIVRIGVRRFCDCR
jgi:hypothetical protein